MSSDISITKFNLQYIMVSYLKGYKIKLKNFYSIKDLPIVRINKQPNKWGSFYKKYADTELTIESIGFPRSRLTTSEFNSSRVIEDFLSLNVKSNLIKFSRIFCKEFMEDPLKLNLDFFIYPEEVDYIKHSISLKLSNDMFTI